MLTDDGLFSCGGCVGWATFNDTVYLRGALHAAPALYGPCYAFSGALSVVVCSWDGARLVRHCWRYSPRNSDFAAGDMRCDWGGVSECGEVHNAQLKIGASTAATAQQRLLAPHIMSVSFDIHCCSRLIFGHAASPCVVWAPEVVGLVRLRIDRATMALRFYTCWIGSLCQRIHSGKLGMFSFAVCARLGSCCRAQDPEQTVMQSATRS